MLQHGFKLAFGAAALVFLASCGDGYGPPHASAQEPPGQASSPFTEQDLRLLVSGAALTTAARDNSKLDELLEKFGEKGRNGNALARIDRLLNTPSPGARTISIGADTRPVPASTIKNRLYAV